LLLYKADQFHDLIPCHASPEIRGHAAQFHIQILRKL